MVIPNENVSAIILRSGRQLDEGARKEVDKDLGLEKDEATTPREETPPPKVTSKPSIPTNISSLPFPSRFANSKKDESEKEMFDMFQKVHVNIPLLDVIKQVPRYAKFLKELCTNKRKLKGNEVINVGENVSAVLQQKLPPKCKDPGSFTIPCIIGNTRFNKVMLDLGASINVMPSFIYDSLNLGPLKKTGVVIELADRSNVYPKGVLDDVLVQVDDLIFPVDFYILDMPKGCSTLSTQLFLGRPFMKTARTKIDVHEGMLSMEFDGRIVKYRIDAMEESLKENPEPAIVCGFHVIPSDGATQKLDSGCKK
ncbi:hypothetical protein UlMin_001066 [Ulmus minor]